MTERNHVSIVNYADMKLKSVESVDRDGNEQVSGKVDDIKLNHEPGETIMFLVRENQMGVSFFFL